VRALGSERDLIPETTQYTPAPNPLEERGAGSKVAVAHQRRLILGLMLWATLLTLGLAASMSLHFFYKEAPAPNVPKGSIPTSSAPRPIPNLNNADLMVFKPKWGEEEVELLEWETVYEKFIKGRTQLTVTESGMYFLYLHVTLRAQKPENRTIYVKTKSRNVILKAHISASNLSTGFMGVGIALNGGDTFNVTCSPKATIKNHHTETYLGVIKLSKS
ncbi:hypothetical protein DNTS_023469, partial [Danionella cerebrum]